MNPTHTVRCRTAWLSDIHLGNKDCKAAYLIDFLRRLDCERLYLVGDIVDLLAMRRRVHFSGDHYQVLCEIRRLADAGTQVIYVPGNHDAELRDFVGSNLLNIEVHRQFNHETVDGRRLLIIHGDELDHVVVYHNFIRLIGDHAYNLMAFMNRWVARGRRLLGFNYWSLATYLKTHLAQARKSIDIFERAAAALAARGGFDGVVCGHIHKAEIRTIDGVLYCNDGDWTESCTALVESDTGDLQILHWIEQPSTLKTQPPLAAAA
ncbi:UDP-2,3-diacylglucosamine diphosphatase [Exilibacterium tricleocarpae]|uniref:UDP-2,3-diacylglucosamine diphosphatase n=1 Tax=Exilibacterium tricleocarpae TaxID=2591008 RepID=A0A545TAM8_9GAMM|nr:UDP-2,3-diacylglucosamine diphosphatase [Exilibacterium tricleocarpae]TQV74257.1 UDP-2,3-diacylglucosamine diphosphatase [Exilibacterium tricleocarpae]